MYQNVENIIPENIPEEISAGTLPINPNDYHRNELCIKDFLKKADIKKDLQEFLSRISYLCENL